MTRIAYTPDRDTSWMERLTPALIANVNQLYDALEAIATSEVHGLEHDEVHDAIRAMRDIAHDALNQVFAWRAPVEQDIYPTAQEQM